MTIRQRLRAFWRGSVWTWTPESEREAGEAIVRNLWLHWFPTKVAIASASWSYSLWLGHGGRVAVPDPARDRRCC